MVWSWDAVDWNIFFAFGMLFLLPIIVLLYLMVKEPGMRKTTFVFLPLFLVLIISIPLSSAYGPWELKAQGVYDHSELYESKHHTSHGSRYTLPHLVIFFNDGRVYELDRIRDLPYPKGTRLRVLTKNGKYKFETY